MHILLLILSVLATTTLAASPLDSEVSPIFRLALSKRSTKAQCNLSDGEKVCGDFCIPATFSCCPDKAGGCPSNKRCFLGDNGEYGCCLKGKTCSGDGGVVSTSTRKSSSSTAASTKPASVTKTNTGSAAAVTSTVDSDPDSGTETDSLEPLTSTFVVYAYGTSSSSGNGGGLVTPTSRGPPTFTSQGGGALATSAGGANPFGGGNTSSAAKMSVFSPQLALVVVFGLLLLAL